ncbi:MAG: phosphoribosyltransferase family protein [Candidatus Bathycorpusculaceae bacterium]
MSFDVEECLASGVFISGAPGSGKTYLAMHIAKILAENNVVLYIIAPTDIWEKKFYLVKDIHHVQSLKNLLIIDWNTHIIFDVSNLSQHERGEFIELLSCEMIKKAKSSPERSNRILIVDECQMPWYNGYFDSNRAPYTKQLLTEGRGYGIRFMAVTQSCATCDKLPIKLPRQRYFFSASEKDDIDYLKEFVGEHVKDLQDLDPGECIYCYRKPKKIKIPKFDETSQLPILPLRSKLTHAVSPHLERAIDEAELIHVDKYDFIAYPFGDAGAYMEGNIIQDITDDVDTLIMNSHLKFDYIVSPRYGSRIGWALAQKRGYSILSVIERPRKLINELRKRGDEPVHLKTPLYNRKVFYRGVKPGDKVIIVDDVVSTGRTMKALIETLRKKGVQVLGVFCVVAKGNRYKEIENLGVRVYYVAQRIPV